MKTNNYFGITLTTLTLSLTLTLTLSSPAMAGANDLLTLGVGASFDVTRIQDLSAPEAAESMTPSLSVRLKLLRVFGAEFSYSPTAEKDASSELVMGSKFRASGLVFLRPFDSLAVYGKAGLGTHNLSQLANPMGENNSYHGGVGLDIHMGEHFALGGEYLVLIPSADSIATALSKHGLGSTNENLGRGTGGVTPRSGVAFQMSDLIRTDNYQASVTLRYYF